MNDNLDWTQDLGDTVLAQQEDVMDAVQRLRKEAQNAGNLETTQQQRVETTEDTIVVQPADPEVVYVPSYDPSTVYGQTEPPATTYYPTTYTTPVYSAPSTTDNLIGFGAGALVGGLLTAAIMWDNDDDRIYYGGPGYYGRPGYWNSPNYWSGGWRRAEDIKIDRDVNIERGDINVNKGIVGNDIKKWEHNPERRGGVRYRNEQTQQKFANARKERHIDGDAARGRDPDRQKLANLQGPGKGNKPMENRELAIKRPETPAVKRPAAQRPSQSRNVKRPQSRPANVRPPKRNTQRVAAPKKRTPARRDGGKASAFKVKGGASSRAASKRGAASRGGGRAKHRGGGGGGGRRHRG
jgi:hypothetical protein